MAMQVTSFALELCTRLRIIKVGKDHLSVGVYLTGAYKSPSPGLSILEVVAADQYKCSLI